MYCRNWKTMPPSPATSVPISATAGWAGCGAGCCAWANKQCWAARAVITGIEPHHRLAREEIFAPILAVLSAPDFAAALEITLDSDYALTGGVFSRLPEHLELARSRLRVDNLYLNRGITGARVGVQPFGGPALSGGGIQAGGPEYLKQFLWRRTATENTLRHGFVA
jgi:RHH-type proline utilization regulon transcriptional repressor/proline dehydrogenase/delta 1-pyrroline-5-carboxylate dehydrogenase